MIEATLNKPYTAPADAIAELSYRSLVDEIFLGYRSRDHGFEYSHKFAVSVANDVKAGRQNFVAAALLRAAGWGKAL
ncbi:hypothetical protein [Vibrio mediterranei]|jgi:hypothetical protein|uniref:hypothetical protein n=1 Tax=Vibrio mediterranei TaxID=689 RepID=UPI0022835B4D|nr:hypothetical protein [Vibrio mediterranei]MCY9855307.1 hypothetical protein [Vibrio mediterranei]